MVEFASKAWLAALREALPAYVAQAGPGLELSLCEVFTNVPAHLDPEGRGQIAWHCRIHDGQIDFADGEADDVDWKIVTDYDFILPCARLVLDDENAASNQAYVERGVAQGLHRSAGDRTKIPPGFQALHNELARRTQ